MDSDLGTVQRAVNRVIKFKFMFESINSEEQDFLDLICDAFEPFSEELNVEIGEYRQYEVLNVIHKSPSRYDNSETRAFLYKALKNLYLKNGNFRTAFDELVK